MGGNFEFQVQDSFFAIFSLEIVRFEKLIALSEKKPRLANIVFLHISFSIRNKVGEAHRAVIFLFYIVIMRKYGKAISCFRKRQSQNVLSSCFPNLVLLHISF